MAESIWAFREGRRLSQWLLKDILYHILLALDYLHSEAKLIHAGLSHLSPAS